jgi:hypothetical protein
MGDGVIFLKTSAPHSLMTTRINLHRAGRYLKQFFKMYKFSNFVWSFICFICKDKKYVFVDLQKF